MTLLNKGRWVEVVGHFLYLGCKTVLTANSNLTDLLLFLEGVIFLFPLQFLKCLLL